jgi:hypothetical protein
MLSKDFQSKLHRLTLGFWASKEELQELANAALQKPGRIKKLFEFLFHEEPRVQAQTARAICRVAEAQPALIQPYKDLLFQDVAVNEHWILRASFCRMIPKLKLTSRDIHRVEKILVDYLNDESSVVKTCAMEALFELTRIEPKLRDDIMPLLEFLTHTGTPAMRARGRQLFKIDTRRRKYD